MRLLQRYILMDLIRVFVTLVSVLTVVLVFVGVFQQMSEQGLQPEQVFRILPFVVPSLLPFTIPATLLLTVCLVYGRMSGDQEITAAKAAGINVFSLVWPSLLLAAILSFGSLVLSDRVIPWAVNNIQRTIALAAEDIFLDVLRNQQKLTEPSKGYEITVTRVEGKTLVNPTFKYSRGNSPIILQARRGELEFDLEGQRVILHLESGSIKANGNMVFFRREDQPFPMPTEITEPKARNMPIAHLQRRVAENKAKADETIDRRRVDASIAFLLGDFGPHDVVQGEQREQELQHVHGAIRRDATEINSRLALSASCFFFVLLGAPVAILQARRQFLTTFLLCFLPILLAYYPIVLGMMSLSKSGSIDPTWAMWTGNAALAVGGGYFLWRVLRY